LAVLGEGATYFFPLSQHFPLNELVQSWMSYGSAEWERGRGEGVKDAGYSHKYDS
jgi:hypothetical protein